MSERADVVGAVEEVVDDTDHLEVTGDELALLRDDETFQRLAVAIRELDSLLDDGEFTPVTYARTFTSTARGKLRLAVEERARVVLDRPVPLPPEDDEEESETFEGVVVDDGSPVVLDDGEETLSIGLDLDVSLGDGLRVEGSVHSEDSTVTRIGYDPIGVVTGSEARRAVVEGDVVYVHDHESESAVAAGFDDVEDARAWIEASDREEVETHAEPEERSGLEPVDAREL